MGGGPCFCRIGTSLSGKVEWELLEPQEAETSMKSPDNDFIPIFTNVPLINVSVSVRSWSKICFFLSLAVRDLNLGPHTC
jgi:hypothetical protein